MEWVLSHSECFTGGPKLANLGVGSGNSAELGYMLTKQCPNLSKFWLIMISSRPVDKVGNVGQNCFARHNSKDTWGNTCSATFG